MKLDYPHIHVSIYLSLLPDRALRHTTTETGGYRSLTLSPSLYG